MRMNIKYENLAQNIEIADLQAITSYSGSTEKQIVVYNFVKRLFDIVASIGIIVLFFPLWIAVVLIIKFTSKGPVFYKPVVVGKGEQNFVMYKFRSMYYKSSVDVHKNLVVDMIKNNKSCEKLKNDSRITPFGKFIRKYSIDEIPQLINVLRGEMSLVGPRPCLPYEHEVMNAWHKKRFSVKPGMTGLWQVTGRSRVNFNEQINLDIKYSESKSTKLDFSILIRTIPVMIFGRGGF